MNSGRNPNILFWSLLVYILLFFGVVGGFVFSFLQNKFSFFSFLMLSVLVVIVYIFLFRVIIPIMILQKKNIQTDVVHKNLGNSFETLNNLLSGAWVNIVEENTRLLEKDYSNEILINKIRFRTLQSQINPHFLYNALDSIRSLALIENSTKTAEMAEALGAFFRYNISYSISIVRLEGELQNIDNYFIIQRYRFSNRFSLEYDFDRSDKDILEYPIPKMTIQPLVENAVFHGLERKRDNGTVVISIEKTSTRLFIRVTDNGIGMDASAVSSLNQRLRSGVPVTDELENVTESGIGLINVSQRIHSIYGHSYGANISSTIGLGTEIEITLPFPADKSIERSMS